MNPLESRKQLLIAESEINREQMVQEWQALRDDAHSLARQARTITSLASMGGLLVATLAACRRSKASPENGKPTWFRTVANGAKLAGSLWLAFRSRPKS